jgi:hypothetical protein
MPAIHQMHLPVEALVPPQITQFKKYTGGTEWTTNGISTAPSLDRGRKVLFFLGFFKRPLTME